MSKSSKPNPDFKTVQMVPGGKKLDCFYNIISNRLFITLPMDDVKSATAIYAERVNQPNEDRINE